MIDTHTHIYMPDAFDDGGVGAVDRALEAGVRHMVLPNVDVESANNVLRLHRARPEATSVASGLHPSEVKSDWRDMLREIDYRFEDTPLCAIGEVGVDLHWEQDYLHQQMDCFGYQLQTAHERGLPVIIHSRDALDETLEVLDIMGADMPPVLFHSYTGDAAGVRKVLERLARHDKEPLFAFNGVITFKNAASVREAATEAGINRIVLETDAPWLAPAPHRGSQNESNMIPYILDAVAAATSQSRQEAERITDENACRFFGLNL